MRATSRLLTTVIDGIGTNFIQRGRELTSAAAP